MKRVFFITYVLLLFALVRGQSHKDLFAEELASAALLLTEQEVVYDPAYYAMGYPNGDVPADRGVCTDVVIRAYRMMDIDLQKEVHEDMLSHFGLYPDIWGLSLTDTNIDHRRVPNLMKYFERRGTEKEITDNPADYLPGDIVCWNLGGAVTHIGIIAGSRSVDGLRPMVVHNIGRGQVLEDCLFDYRIIGHYAYQGNNEIE
ncbi:MAG: DUF1287 domain-containing protein [Bacteroidota bacterium]|nr:DUF1287 domain-containing protein [Bacteroidota bacterium]